jgi:hypothetical protein
MTADATIKGGSMTGYAAGAAMLKQTPKDNKRKENKDMYKVCFAYFEY